MQIVIALSINTHCLLFMHRIPIILPPNKHPCCLSLSYAEASLPSMQDSKQQTNSCLVYAERTHTCWVCVCLPYLEIIKFLSCLHYISNQSVASFPDCGNSGLGMRLGKWNFPSCIPCFSTGARMHKSGARVRRKIRNRVEFTVSTKK